MLSPATLATAHAAGGIVDADADADASDTLTSYCDCDVLTTSFVMLTNSGTRLTPGGTLDDDRATKQRPFVDRAPLPKLVERETLMICILHLSFRQAVLWWSYQVRYEFFLVVVI